MEDEWFYATATPLPDGKVFIASGYNDSLQPTNQTWIYQPPDCGQARFESFIAGTSISQWLRPEADFDAVIAHEEAISPSLGGRCVFDDKPRQLSLF